MERENATAREDTAVLRFAVEESWKLKYMRTGVMKLLAMYPMARYLASTRKMISLAHSSSSTCASTTINYLWPTKPRLRWLLSTNYDYVSKSRMMSLCRQNYPEECEAGVNRQINLELYASYVYTSMAYHFNRDDVALPGFYTFFKSMSEEERDHAEHLLKYQSMRGGRIVLQDIKKPEIEVWENGLDAMMSALKLEKHVNQCLLDLHHIAENKNDPQLEDFLEGEFLKEQVESIKQFSDFVTQLNRVGPGLGEYLFDKETLQELKKRIKTIHN